MIERDQTMRCKLGDCRVNLLAQTSQGELVRKKALPIQSGDKPVIHKIHFLNFTNFSNKALE